MSQLPPGFVLDTPAQSAAPAKHSGPVWGAPAKADDPYKARDQQLQERTASRADAEFAMKQKEYNATHEADGTPKAKAEPKQQVYSQSAMDSFDRALNSIETLKKHPGMAAAVGSGFDPAAIGSFNPFTEKGRSGVPMAGTAAAGFVARLNALKAQMFLPMVQSMKGMGALSDAEGRKLTDAVGALDPSMPEDDFLNSMEGIKADLQKYRDRAASLPHSSPSTPHTKAPRQPTVSNW